MPLILKAEEVRAALSLPEAMSAIEAALKAEAAGETAISGRANLMFESGWMRLASATLPSKRVIGFKEFHLLKGVGVRYSIQLIDAAEGKLLAMLDGDEITAARTGATAGIAARSLAPAELALVVVIGSGFEAKSQLRALAEVRMLGAVVVHSPRASSRERFCEEMAAELGVEATPAADPREALAAADMVIAATTTGGSIALEGDQVRAGAHVSSIGSTLPNQREIDARTWARADLVVIDSPDVLTESGDAIAAEQEGVVEHERVVGLAEVVSGAHPGRRGDESTLYKSIGSPLQDVAIAAMVLERARDAGLGREIEDYQSVKTIGPPKAGGAAERTSK